MKLSDPGAWARAAFFAILPPFAAGGALGLPLLFSAAGLFQVRPRLIASTLAKPPLWLAALLLFATWAALSNLWAAAPAQQQTLKLVALLAFGLMFAGAASAPATRRLTQAAGIAAFAVLAILLGIEALFDMPFIRSAQPGVEPGRLAATLTRGGTVLLALTWPTIAALEAQGRPNAARLALLASGFMTLQFDQNAAVLAFLVGLATLFVARVSPKIALYVITGGLAVWLLAAPFATPILLSDQGLIERLPASWQERAHIWTFACERIYAAPWLGYGLDSARAAGWQIPLHPHSASLQIWYETGAVGAALAALALIAGGLGAARIFRDNPNAASAAAAAFASLGVVANLSYGAWQEWWVTTIFITASLIAALSNPGTGSVDFASTPATKPQT